MRRQGRVLAVFRRSFYVRFGRDPVCIGPVALGAGPLNALCAMPGSASWSDRGIEANMEVVRAKASLHVGDRLRFDFAAADVWVPPTAPAVRPASLHTGLRLLAESAARRSPGGLGPLLWLASAEPATCARASLSDPMLQAALPTVVAVRRWLASALAGDDTPLPAVDALIGLGGGLTPSGDDFLCGVMTALHYLGRKEIAARIAQSVLPLAARDTNLISAAYLRCAASGEASSVLFDVLACLAGAERALLEQRLDAVDRVGHTSGWDCLAGAVSVAAEIAARSSIEAPGTASACA